MNWFQRHLNWTWGLAYLLWFVINTYANDPFGIAWWLSLVAAIFWLILSGWVIKEKGRSLWWILLAPFFSPLWLKNMSMVSQSLPTIQDEERQECLAYYAQEKRLRLLYERVEQLFDKRLGKYEDEYFRVRKHRGWKEDELWPSLEKIGEVTEYFSEAATEIVKRKKEMRPAPSPASAMSSTWLAAYLDYEALRHSLFDAAQVAIKREIEKERSTRLKESLRKAWKEEKEFRKRLKLGSGEYQRIVDWAAIAVAADEWLRKLEAECP